MTDYEDEDMLGHNSSGAGSKLESQVKRIERLEEEKAAIAADIRDVYSELKSDGFDVKIVRKVVRLRKQDAAERQEEESLLEAYLHSLGMI